jgi:hypothetical protein
MRESEVQYLPYEQLVLTYSSASTAATTSQSCVAKGRPTAAAAVMPASVSPAAAVEPLLLHHTSAAEPPLTILMP